MKISGTSGAVVALLLLSLVGGATYFFKTVQETKQRELKAQEQKARLEIKAAEAKIKEEERLKAEEERKTKEEERKNKEADNESKRLQNEKEKNKQSAISEERALATAQSLKADALRRAAETETAKAKAAAKAAEKQIEADKKRIEAEILALKRAEAEQKKAEAELAEKLAVKQIAEAALAKSENELKAAEANAAAEHDRKLRLYARANTSRAELLALQRAEKLLALDESGRLGELTEENEPEEHLPAQATNAVVNVEWKGTVPAQTEADKALSAIVRAKAEKTDKIHKAAIRNHIETFIALSDKSEAEGRTADATYYRKTLASLVPDYIDAFIDLADEYRKAGDGKAATKCLDDLIAIVPDWQHVALFVRLIKHDEAYYSRELAGRITQDEYVKSFRKIYDEARRDKGDRDERDAKIEHICKVLATYVPDFENSPEWK